jgi:uncharacterized protein
MNVVGIDLAGVESRPTGFCLMNDNLQVSTCILHYNKEIIEEVIKFQPEIIAIDAPLALPIGRESLSKRNNIHLRECDRELIRMGIRFFPLTIGPMRLLTERGIWLKKELERKSLKVIETYPGAVQDILGIPRKGKGLNLLEAGLRERGIKNITPGMSGDELDAVTCALVGIMYLTGKYLAIGRSDEILMILPRS